MEKDLSVTPEGQLAMELGTATQEANMGEPMYTGLDGADDISLEPDLPPTPTQLGLVKALDRPTDLMSSSPSARHEKRMKRKAADTLRGSPLKAIKFRPQSPEEILDPDPDLTGDGATAAVFERRKLRKSLAAELHRIKKRC